MLPLEIIGDISDFHLIKKLLLTAVAVDLAFSFSKYFLLNMSPTP